MVVTQTIKANLTETVCKISSNLLNEIIKKSLDAEPFEIESIYKGMQDEIRKKITFLKSEIKNKQILNVLQKLSLK